MLENIQAVLFDLDGTLIDSMWLWKAIDMDYLRKYGIEFPEGLQTEIEGKSFTETALYFKDKFQLVDDVETIKKEWNRMAGEYYAHKVLLKERVLPFLEYLKQNNILMGIGTSNSKELVGLIVDKFHLNHYFTSIRTSCEVPKGKPHPDIYLMVADDLGIKPENCLVFEDVPMGIMAGKNAGMRVCAIYDEFSHHVTHEIKALSDYYINNFNEMIEMIEDKTIENEYSEAVFAN